VQIRREIGSTYRHNKYSDQDAPDHRERRGKVFESLLILLCSLQHLCWTDLPAMTVWRESPSAVIEVIDILQVLSHGRIAGVDLLTSDHITPISHFIVGLSLVTCLWSLFSPLLRTPPLQRPWQVNFLLLIQRTARTSSKTHSGDRLIFLLSVESLPHTLSGSSAATGADERQLHLEHVRA
jgi:hypothetical protein